MDIDRQFAREIAESREADVGFFLGAIVANSFSRDDLHDVGHLGRLHIIGAGLLGLADHLHRRIEIGRGSRPDRIWIRPARNVWLCGGFCHAGCIRLCQQGIELAFVFERVEFVAAADMGRADENLRHGGAPIRALGHLARATPDCR